MISRNRCKTCGGIIEFDVMARQVECPSCGLITELGEGRTKFLNLYSQADDAWGRKDFDESLKLYEEIVAQDNTQAEAHWGAALSRYGVGYELDPISLKQMPVCNRINRDSILNDKNYLSAVKYATAAEKAKYEERALEIDRISKEFLKIVDKEKPRDVFISYKRTDAEGGRTIDSQIAKRLYLILKEKGFNVFFAEESLKEVGGEKYEPYIFAALTSAKVMILFGSCRENFEATWVKNEWRRFLALSATDPHKTLIPAYIQCDPYEAMPRELLSIQAFDALSPVFNEEIADLIGKKLGEAKAPAAPKTGKKLTERYATKEKVKAVVKELDCDPEIASEALVIHQGNLPKTVEYIANDSEYKKKMWVCAECKAKNTHDVCHNPTCGLSREESQKISRRRAEVKRAAEKKKQSSSRSFVPYIVAIIVVVAIVAVIFNTCSGGLGDSVYENTVEHNLGSIVIFEYDGHYYHIPIERKDWDGAKAYCESLGGHLVSINSEDENDYVKGLIKYLMYDKTEVFIGAYNDDGTWRWSNGDSFDVDFWGKGEPNGGAYAAYGSSGKLNWGAVGNIEARFVCEWENLDGVGGVDASLPTIRTAAELAAIANTDASYRLISDIDLSDVEWTPISGFTGTLDGGGYAIKNLTLNTSEGNVGLFSTLSGTVKNLKIENANINVDSKVSNVGILCGTLERGMVSEITVSGKLEASYCNNVGAIAGRISVLNSNAVIKDLTNEADIRAYNYVGGLFGHVQPGCNGEGDTVTFEKLTNKGSVTGEEYVGGIISYTYFNGSHAIIHYDFPAHIIACTNTGAVTGTNYVGGIVGWGDTDTSVSTLTRCTNAAKITGDSYVGCVAGYCDMTVSECSNEGSSLVVEGFMTRDGKKLAYIGGYVGYGEVITDCVNHVEINYTGSGQFVGGIMGYSTGYPRNATLSDLENTKNVSGFDYVGGIFGSMVPGCDGDGDTVSLLKVKNSGNITGTNNVGGIVGYMYFNGSHAIVHYNFPVYFTTVTNSGNIKGETRVGGLIGYGYSDTSVSELLGCSSTGTVEGISDVNEIGGKLDNITIK